MTRVNEEFSKRHSTSSLFAVTWNVQSLVEDVGDERICRKNASLHSSGVDRKLDFLVDELVKFRVDIAGQEMK